MEDSIRIHVPVAVSYQALEGVLRNQLIGTYIPRPEDDPETPPYAQVLDVGISGSGTGPHEVILRVKIRILRTVLKRDEVDLYVLAALEYDNTSQQLYVQQFHLSSKTNSGFYNTALEVLANKVAYTQILKKARVNLKDIIAGELVKANGLLNEGLNLKGIRLAGAVKEVRLLDIVPLPDKLTLSVELKADVEASILDFASLMPPK